MATPLPLPKHRWLRLMVVELYVLSFLAVFTLVWKMVGGKSWGWYEDRMAFGFLYTMLALGVENIGDYYAWRDKIQPLPTIKWDRDETQARVNRSSPEVKEQ